MREKVITVAYRIVSGAAKQYPYVGAKLYRARKRKYGKYTYHPIKELGPSRRSYTLATQDAKSFCRRFHVAFEEGIRLGSGV